MESKTKKMYKLKVLLEVTDVKDWCINILKYITFLHFKVRILSYAPVGAPHQQQNYNKVANMHIIH